jgi:hypothetical protein
MKPRRNEEAQAHIGLSSHRKKEKKVDNVVRQTEIRRAKPVVGES